MKTHFFRARMAGCLIAALVLASCAADDAATDPITDTSQAPGSSVTVQDTAGGDDMAGMDEMEGADHDHEEGAVTEWEGAPPQLEIVVGDGLITLEATGFEFVDPSETEPVAGRGHTHVYVDGRLLSMAYERSVPLPDLGPGMHEIEITLAAADHTDYVIDGEIVGVTTTLEIEGEVAAVDLTIEVSFEGGAVVVSDPRPSASLGSTVEIVVTSDVGEELHIHGYDLTLEIGAGETRAVRFQADIPGIFEVEFEESGNPVLDLTVS